MPSAERPPRKPVTIIHFPKQGKPRPRPTAPSQTVTEMRAMDEVTDPYTNAVEDPALAAARTPAPRRPTPPPSKVTAVTPPPTEKKGRKSKTQEIPAVTPLPETVLSELANAKKVKTPQQAADLSMFGHQLFEMGRVDEARQVFEALIQSQPRDGFAHTMLGTVFLALNKQDRALTMFQAALKIDATDLAALVYRAEIRLNRGKGRAAMEDLLRAITLGNPADPFVDRAKRLMRMAKALVGKKKK